KADATVAPRVLSPGKRRPRALRRERVMFGGLRMMLGDLHERAGPRPSARTGSIDYFMSLNRSAPPAGAGCGWDGRFDVAPGRGAAEGRTSLALAIGRVFAASLSSMLGASGGGATAVSGVGGVSTVAGMTAGVGSEGAAGARTSAGSVT